MYVEVNQLGAELWTLLASGGDVGSAVDAVRRRYDAAPDVIESDARRMFAELLGAGLLEQRDSG